MLNFIFSRAKSSSFVALADSVKTPTILDIASSTCTPLLLPSSSCHSSTASIFRVLKNSGYFFCASNRCRLSGVIMSTSGICLVCLCLSAMSVSPFLMPIFQLMPSSSITSSIARPISLANARRGVIHNSCKPSFDFFL